VHHCHGWPSERLPEIALNPVKLSSIAAPAHKSQ
jgi:hypothetical protein